MPYTLEDFRRDSARSLLNSFTPEEILTHYKAERLFSRLPLEERLAGLSAEELESLTQMAMKKQASCSSVSEI